MYIKNIKNIVFCITLFVIITGIVSCGAAEAEKQRVGVRDPEGKMSGYTVYEGDLPSITFTEKDKGIVVSVIRAILIPQQDV